MADNVSFQSATLATPAAATSIATDDVGGTHYQRVKLDAGGDGASVPILAGTGAAASAIRVALADSSTCAATQSGTWNITNISGTISLPTGAATAAKQPALGTAGTASSDVITVQGIASMVALKVDGSAVTQPVSGTVTVQDGGGAITVDGTVAATQSGTWTVTGTGGTFPVTDSGGSLTVDAPVGAPVFVQLSDGAAPITTLPVSLASVPSHAVTNAGTFAVQESGAALTALQIMDDWDNAASDGASVSGDVAHDAADAGEPVKIGAKATAGQSGATMVAANDRTNLAADIDGVLIARPVSLADTLQEAVSDTGGTSTAFSTFGATASAKNVVTALSVFRTDAGTTLIYVDFRDGTGGSVIYRVPIPPGGGVVLGNGAAPLFKQPTANTALAYDVSAATTTVYISVTGFQTKV